MGNTHRKCGLFVGITTWDLIYLATSMPASNQKTVALDYTTGCGGPATNAAICFRHLGDRWHYRAKLMTAMGSHAIAGVIKSELANWGVEFEDLAPQRLDPPPISSIIVTQNTGERAVISINATNSQISSQGILETVLDGVNLVLIDGHQMELSQHIASLARKQSIPVVIDGGSWKPGWDGVLPHTDYAICSANFLPPNCRTSEDVFAYLTDAGVPHMAITKGEKPIEYRSYGKLGEIPALAIAPLDTLGAGDIFHGAFCYYIIQKSFPEALAAAARIAANSCLFFGTKLWMKSEPKL